MFCRGKNKHDIDDHVNRQHDQCDCRQEENNHLPGLAPGLMLLLKEIHCSEPPEPETSVSRSPEPGLVHLELHLNRLARFLVFQFQQMRRLEVERAGNHAIGKLFAPVIVIHDRVVEMLAGEGDLVFR